MLYTISWFYQGKLFAKTKRYFANAQWAYWYAWSEARLHAERFGHDLVYEVRDAQGYSVPRPLAGIPFWAGRPVEVMRSVSDARKWM